MKDHGERNYESPTVQTSIAPNRLPIDEQQYINFGIVFSPSPRKALSLLTERLMQRVIRIQLTVAFIRWHIKNFI